MIRLLTVKFIEALKPELKRYVVSDTASPNLCLIVYTTGTRAFQWRGRFIGGPVKTYTLGRYPIHGLAEARSWANEITEGRDRGVNIIDRRAAEAEATTRTMDWLFEVFMTHAGGKLRTAASIRACYERDFRPVIGSMPVEKIDHDVLASIIVKKAQTAPTQANRLASYIKRIFNWSVSQGHPHTGLKVNPAIDIFKPSAENARERHFDDYEIGVLSKALRTVPYFAEPVLMLVYTGARKSEVFDLRWSEIDFEKGYWLLPRARSKNGVELLLPLPATILDMLKARLAKSTGRDRVWPSKAGKVGEVEKPISGFSKLLLQLNLEMSRIAASDGRVIQRWSLHDLRRTLSSGMNGMLDENEEPLIDENTIGRILNHKIPGVRGVYNRHGYLAQKRRALRLWAEHLDEIRRKADE